jgi:hypothetical protein
MMGLIPVVDRGGEEVNVGFGDFGASTSDQLNARHTTKLTAVTALPSSSPKILLYDAAQSVFLVGIVVKF